MPSKKPEVDILQPKTWVPYQSTLCTGCRAGCCTLPVTVTAEDLYHMGFLQAAQVNGPLKRIAQQLMRQGIVRSFNSRTRIFTLAQRANHDCIFLGPRTRRCTLYANRPQICRRFPENSIRPGYCPAQQKMDR